MGEEKEEREEKGKRGGGGGRWIEEGLNSLFLHAVCVHACVHMLCECVCVMGGRVGLCRHESF